MTLMEAILNKVTSQESIKSDKKLFSPPPELDDEFITGRKKRRVHKYAHIPARVDTSPPMLDMGRHLLSLSQWKQDQNKIFAENIYLMMLIKKAHLSGGKVDSHWSYTHRPFEQYYRTRVDFMKRVQRDNQFLLHRFMTTPPRVQTTSSLNREWVHNRNEIVKCALNKFVLFSPVPQQDMEDPAFAAPHGYKRPRVYMTLGIHERAVLGELCIELFTDVCPVTSHLFTELLDGDTLGHGYVGTCFYRKVPHLYWSGGDVIYDNGFGCYAQRGRIRPIGAENFHFSHSMPGLLSMRVTCDDEVCGLFNITFKALPQFDLKNVVFGRIIRPSLTYDTLRGLGSALSSQPVVEVRSSRRKHEGKWIRGESNTRILANEKYYRQALLRHR
ncbi:uncharacterized protein LOC142985134 [Anticarsia gemmatalis]|uniref:uncharacterized protein LOC142985134 n=1 Tax=Anticarsia gemmatalis TaxID=129554 RepID=UPI003F7768D6